MIPQTQAFQNQVHDAVNGILSSSPLFIDKL